MFGENEIGGEFMEYIIAIVILYVIIVYVVIPFLEFALPIVSKILLAVGGSSFNIICGLIHNRGNEFI